jgi:F-type H+-transporting ATPase subunit b
VNVLSLLVAAEDPTQTHHWLWPETAEIIYGGIAIVLIYVALWKFALPPMKKALAARTARIQKQLDDSAADTAAAEAEASRIKASLRDLAADKARILETARADAERMKLEGAARNDAEVAELETRAEADIASAASRLESEIAAQVAVLSGEAADRIVADRLDNATKKELVEQFIANVGAAS